MFFGFDGAVHKLIAAGQHSEAAALIREKIRGSPRPKARHLNLLAVCETHMGHYGTAHELFSQALLLSPRDAEPLNNLGNLAFVKKDMDTARDYYLRSLRENVWATEPRHNLTVLYQELGYSERALSAYEDYMAVTKAIRWTKTFVAGVLTLLLLVLVSRI